MVLVIDDTKQRNHSVCTDSRIYCFQDETGRLLCSEKTNASGEEYEKPGRVCILSTLLC